jgi:hypothetical protein
MIPKISPVLFLMFNRPALAGRVFERIREVRPFQLFVAIDGPRLGNEADVLLTKQCRDLLTEIDWPCEVCTLIRKDNLGCKAAVSSAISWFFENVGEGIILEDDCLPSRSFFRYTSELLERYREKTEVLSIGGCSLGYSGKFDKSYGFSGVMNMWGWGSWSDRARSIDYSVSNWSEDSSRKILLSKLVKMKLAGAPFRFSIYQAWAAAFEAVYTGRVDTWDYQWIYHGIMNGKVSVFPTQNMIENIGFGGDSTHTVSGNHPLAKLLHQDIQFPLSHPTSFKLNRSYMRNNIYQSWGENNLSWKKDLISILTSFRNRLGIFTF